MSYDMEVKKQGSPKQITFGKEHVILVESWSSSPYKSLDASDQNNIQNLQHQHIHP